MDTDRTGQLGGVLLLFEGSGRPDLQSICEIVDKLPHMSISLDPSHTGNKAGRPVVPQATAPSEGAEMLWLELLVEGLTFDLVGLAPGRPINIPEIRHRLDLSDDFLESTADALCLMPGPHLSGGVNSLPVVRVMLGLVAALTSSLSAVRAVFWPPAGTAMGPSLFRANAESWIAGGPFPAHALIGFRPMTDGSLQTEGLAFFTGQEIRIEHESVGDYPTAIQLANRLVQQLVQHGPLTQTEEVMAPDGSQMRLQPSGNGKFVRVWRG